MAAGNGMHGVTESIERGAATAENTVASIEQKRVRLQGTVNEVMSTWHGNAARGFAEAYTVWDTECRKLNQMLGQLGQDTRFSGRQYMATDEENMSTITACMGGKA